LRLNFKFIAWDSLFFTLRLKHKKALKSGDKSICVYWDFSSYKCQINGCQIKYEVSNAEYSVCECNHLTNFAVIVDVNGTKYGM